MRRLVSLLILGLCATFALADEMLLVYPGKPGSQAQAKNLLESFSDYVESRCGWGKGALHATYYNDEAAGKKALADQKPTWGILSLSVYLKWKKAGTAMTLVAQSELDRRPTMQFHLLVPKDSKVNDLKTLAGANVASSYIEDRRFATNVLFKKELDAAKDVAVIDTRMILTAQTYCARFRLTHDGRRIDALLVDDEQLRGLQGKARDFKRMRIVWQSDPLPTPPVVRFGASDAAQEAKLLTVLKDMPGNAPGRKLLDEMTTTGFREPNAAAYAAAEKLY